MVRALGRFCLVILVAGCQAQNPYAPFGPPTIPAPAANQLPYYPPDAANAAAAPAATATRPSISVSGPSSDLPRSTVTSNAADREPIRIVENPDPTRTADSRRGKPQPQPVARPQSGQPAPAPPQSPLRNATGQRSRPDAAVQPASHQSASPAVFQETAPATGAWRQR